MNKIDKIAREQSSQLFLSLISVGGVIESVQSYAGRSWTG